MKWTGGCLCGDIRYGCDDDPVSAGICHCRRCQQWTGGPYFALVGFPTATLRFTKGAPQMFHERGAIKERGFCGQCGSPIWDRYLIRLNDFREEDGDPSGPDTVWVPIGTLDHPERVKLEFHFGVESQLPWVEFHDDLPRTRTEDDPGIAAAFEAARRGEI